MRRRFAGDRFHEKALESTRRDLLDDLRMYEDLDGRSGYGGRPAVFHRGNREYENYRRSLAQARREVMKELKAIQAIENRLGRSRNPQVRELAREVLREAESNNMTVNDLLQALQGPGWRDRLGFLPGGAFSWGIPALLALLFLPSASKKLKGILSKVMEEITELSEKAQVMVERTKEEVEDIVAEAQFNRFKDALDPNSGDNQ